MGALPGQPVSGRLGAVAQQPVLATVALEGDAEAGRAEILEQLAEAGPARMPGLVDLRPRVLDLRTVLARKVGVFHGSDCSGLHRRRVIGPPFGAHVIGVRMDANHNRAASVLGALARVGETEFTFCLKPIC